MSIKKILVVGEFCEGAAAFSYVSAFRSLGYEVELFDCKRKNLAIFSLGNSKLLRLLQSMDNLITNRLFCFKVKRFLPDLVFIAKGDNITHRSIAFIKRKFKLLVVNFYPDNPFCFWNGNSNSNVLRSLPYYACFLIWSKMLIPAISSAGGKNIYYFPFVYDEKLFSKEVNIVESDIHEYSSDVCFVGTWEPERERWLESLVKKMSHLNISVWGNDWNENLSKNSILRKFLRGQAIYGVKMIKAFRLSKIVLNFIRQQNMTSHNMRTMEVPASGGFLLTERTKEQASELFKEGESISCFGYLDELVEKVSHYLSCEDERLRIAKKSWEVVKNYELQNRLMDFLVYLEGLK